MGEHVEASCLALERELEFEVQESDSAYSQGSGELRVLSTPRLCAWLERASWECVSARLGPWETTVGSYLDVKHLAPSAVGSHVRVRAAVVSWTGRRIEFELSAYEGGREIMRGRHGRVVVDGGQFMATLEG